MKKIAQPILFFSLFLLLSSFTVKAAPTWSDNTSSTPTNYSSTNLSEFYVTWVNDVNITFITITNSTTVLVNNASMTNNSGNYSYSINIPAGTWNWTSYANNSSNSWNSTGNITFTIYQADNSVHLYLNGSVDQNKTYTYPESVNATATSSGGVVYLYRNNSPVSNSELILLGNGTYNYTVNASGNQNYSNSTTGLLFYAFVNKGNTSNILNLLLNGSTSNLTIVLPSIISINASEIATGDSDTNYTLWVNGTELINGTFGNGNVSNTSFNSMGIYIYTYNTSGGENWTSGSKSLTLFVTNINYTSVSVTPLNQSNYLMGASYNFSINVSGNISKVYFVANFNNSFVEYSINSINVTNWNKTITVYNNSGVFWVNFTDFKASDFYYWWTIQDINNVWVNTSNITYTVNRTPIIPDLDSDGGWEVIISSTTLIQLTCSYTNAYLNLNGGSCANSSFGSVKCNVYPTSNVTYICAANDAGNYTGSYNRTLVATSSSTTPTPPTTPPTGSFTLLPSVSSITIEPNSTDWITLTLKNTYSYNITKINITISGINASWYNLSNVNISVLQKNGGTDTSLLTLNIPTGAERKNYSLIVSAAGRDSGGNRLTRQTSIKLIIPEIPQNVTNETESSNTTGIGNQTNQTNVTGLSINIKEFVDYIVLAIASVVIILIFVFRNEFTDFIRGNKPKAHPEHKVHEESVVHAEPKKLHHVLSHVKKKISSLNEHRLVIQIKKKEKKEEEKT